MRVKKFFTRRGQALVLYALLIPVLILFVGVGIDLGWYFLNVSRLQNAADATALAGAQALVKSGNKIFSDYYVVALTSDNLPADFETYENILSDNHNFGTLNNYLSTDEDKKVLADGRDSVEEYTRKNLADTEAINNTTNNRSEVSAVDGWSISVNEDGKKVKGTVDLKYKKIDYKNKAPGPLYYVVTLEENIRHLFFARLV